VENWSPVGDNFLSIVKLTAEKRRRSWDARGKQETESPNPPGPFDDEGCSEG